MKIATTTTAITLSLSAIASAESSISRVDMAMLMGRTIEEADNATYMGQLVWANDLCSHLYVFDDMSKTLSDIAYEYPDEFELGLGATKSGEFWNGFYDVANAYRTIKERYPNDWGLAKKITCEALIGNQFSDHTTHK